MMEHCMKEVLVNTRLNASFTLVVSAGSMSIQTILQANCDCKLTMVNLEK